METIYFDKNKKAHASPVSDCVATVDKDIWDFYSDRTCSVDWDIIGGEFIALKTKKQLQVEQQKEDKRFDRNRALEEFDWMFRRFNDEAILGSSTTDHEVDLARYRQYLRRFTNQEGWWTLPILSYEQFLKENP